MKKLLAALLMCASFIPQIQAQRPALIPPVVRFQDQNGKPLAFGTLQSYVAGTTTPLATYADSTTGAVNTNPVVLDATGSATVFLGANVYKLVLKNSAGVVQWTADNIAQGMFSSTYVTSFTGAQGSTRTGAVTAASGDYTCADITGAVCTLPPTQTLYYQTIKVAGTASPQEPVLNFIAGVAGAATNPTITAGGSGYTGAPTVTFSGGTCDVLPTGSANVSTGSVTNPVVSAGGSGYTSAPTVVFTGGGGTGATATAIITGGVVTGITITSGGTGYTSAPAVSFTGGSGSGAAATVTYIPTGAIASMVLNTAGSGCATPPTIAFTGGGGSGAAATVSLTPAGISCVDNPSTTSTDCTFVGGSGGGGGGPYVLTDVSSSRSPGGIYQNTTNGYMYVSGSIGTGGGGVGAIDITEGVSSPTDVVFANEYTATQSGGDAGFYATILPGYFYKVIVAGAVNQGTHHWVEITGGSGGGGGAVSSVSNSDGSLSVTPTTGSVVASLNLGHTNTWTVPQIFPAASISVVALTGVLPIDNGGLGLGAAPISYQILQASNSAQYAPETLNGDGSLVAGGQLIISKSTNIKGGAVGSAPYQSAADSTSFIASPTTSGATYAYGWQPSGSAIAPTAIRLDTLFGQLAASNTWTQPNAFDNDVYIGPVGTATSSANFNSYNLNWYGSFWNGTTSVTDDWVAKVVLGAGTNPTSVLDFSHSGTSGLATMNFPTGSTVNSSPICTTATGCGGSTPGGANYSLQYNNSSAFGGASFNGIPVISTTGPPLQGDITMSTDGTNRLTPTGSGAIELAGASGVLIDNGLVMNGTKITSVAAGTASTDAVNFGQLSGFVLLSPSATQTVAQPSGTTLAVNSLNTVINAGSSLSTAVTTCGSNPTTIQITQTITLGANLTVPSNCTLLFQSAGQIAGSFTLTVNGAIQASPTQRIFAAATTVSGLSGDVPVGWFGAIMYANITAATTGTDSTAAIQATLNSITQGGAALLGSGSYRTIATLTITHSVVGIHGTSGGYSFPGTSPISLLVNTTGGNDILDVTGTGSTYLVWNSFKNFTLQRTVLPTGTAAGMKMEYVGGSVVDNVQSQDSINDFYLLGTPRYGVGYFNNMNGGWGQSVVAVGSYTSGMTLNCFYLDASVVAFNSIIGYNDNCGNKTGNTAITYGMQISGAFLNDIFFDQFGAGQTTHGLVITNTGGGSASSSDIRFTNSILDNCITSCMELVNIASASLPAVTILGGHFAPNASTANNAISITGSSGIVISGIQLASQASNYGIYVSGSSGLSITANQIYYSVQGIYFTGTTQSSITGNTFIGGWSGAGSNWLISLNATSTNNTITGNAFSGTSTNGIIIDGTSGANQISANAAGSGITTPISGTPAAPLFLQPAFLGSTASPTAIQANGTGSLGVGTLTPWVFNGANVTGSGTNAQISSSGVSRLVLNSAGNSEFHFISTGAPANAQAWRMRALSSTGHFQLGVNSSNYASEAVAMDCSGTAVTTASCAFPSPITTPQVIASGSAPTMAPGAAAGTLPTCTTITGSNMAGVITCTTGTATVGTGTLATITFNGTVTTAPQGCTLMPRNSATAAADLSIFTTAPSTSGWTIGVGTVAVAISTAYSWSYSCI